MKQEIVVLKQPLTKEEILKSVDKDEFIVAVKVPDYIGKLKVVPVVWDDGWKEKKENHNGSILR